MIFHTHSWRNKACMVVSFKTGFSSLNIQMRNASLLFFDMNILPRKSNLPVLLSAPNHKNAFHGQDKLESKTLK